MSKKETTYSGSDVAAIVVVTVILGGLLSFAAALSHGDSERQLQRQADRQIEARMCSDFAERHATAAETLDRLLECKGTYGDLIPSQDIVRYQTRALSEQIAAHQAVCANCDGITGVFTSVSQAAGELRVNVLPQ